LEKGLLDTESFELNDCLRHLISYIETSASNDNELEELYNSVFLQYLTYCRHSFHKELVDIIGKKI
jgi:hypothetical protein